ncbi:hypothetical protein [uncultured Mediterranean phage]|nr:hypothetical protein [uncultured Mediterranean phage]
MNKDNLIELLRWYDDHNGYFNEIGADYDRICKEAYGQFNFLNLPFVSNSAPIETPLTYCPKCKSTDIRQYTKGYDKCNNCNHAWDIYRPFKGVE